MGETHDDYCEKMKRDGEWATDVEIKATAFALKVSIFVYSENLNLWQRFGPEEYDADEPAIYLTNCGNHYQVVLDVESIGKVNFISTEYLNI